MDDVYLTELREKWREATTPRERLIWARTYWQARAGAVNGTATDAALSLGMKPGTYAAYERNEIGSKHTKLDHQKAIEFSRKFKVYWPWLLTGEENPFGKLPEPQSRVVEAMSSMTEEQQLSLVQFIENFRERKAG